MITTTAVVFLLAVSVCGDTTSTEQVQQIHCPPRVQRFSSHESPGHFYQCNEARLPVLQQCPPGHVYHVHKQTCLTKDDTPKNKPIDEKAMGRGVSLGALYNAKNQFLFEDSFLWKQTTVNENKDRYSRKEVTTQFTADKTKRDKTSHFDIDARLALGFMGGMVEVSGAMSYLDDVVESENEVNVEMLFHTTKYTETIPKTTPRDYQNECDTDKYTHVVTSVTYGLDCNFVFKYILAKHESESSITGELKVAINNIPSFSISGSGSVNLTESEKNLVEHTSLKMYGDYDLGQTNFSIPSDFDSAVTFYKALPKLASMQQMPLEVHMTPIENVCDMTDSLLNDLSDSMMAEVIDMLDKFNQLQIKANGLANSHEAEKFPALQDNLIKYKDALTTYSDNVTLLLGKIIPNIRGGDGNGEDDLIVLLDNYNKSPFEYETSDQFLIDRSREISAISFLLESFPDDAANIAIVDYEQATDTDFIVNHDYVTMLVFNILTPKSLTDNFLNGNIQDESNFWYNDITINGFVGSLLRNFSDFALENAEDTEEKSKYGYMINLEKIKEGDDIPTLMTALYLGKPIDVNGNTNFEVPSAPLEPHIQHISYNKFDFIVPKFNEFTKGLLVTITDMYEDLTYEKEIDWDEGAGEGEDIEIIVEDDEDVKVNPATVYSVVAQYKTRVGLGPKSDPSQLFITAPSTPPQNLAISDISSNSLTVSWDKPQEIGSGIDEEMLIYSVELTGEDGYKERKVTNEEHTLVFENLVDATEYNIEAKTYINVDDTQDVLNGTFDGLLFVSTSQSAFIYQNSNPLSPKMIPSKPGEVTTNFAIARWEPPARLPAYESLQYVLQYAPADADGSLGDWVEVTADGLYYEVTGMAMNTKYAFRVKVVTNVGESNFSPNLVVKTLDEQSDLGHFANDVQEDLQEIIDEMNTRSSFCASKSSFNDNAIITFDKLILEETSDVGASLDVSTGIFTAGSGGSYQVMVSAEVEGSPGQEHNIWIAVNGEKVEESRIHTKYDNNMLGVGIDNASRDILLSLGVGEQVTVIHQTEGNKQEGQVLNVIFCVASVKLS